MRASNLSHAELAALSDDSGLSLGDILREALASRDVSQAHREYYTELTWDYILKGKMHTNSNSDSERMQKTLRALRAREVT